MSTFYPVVNGRSTAQLSTSRLLFQIHTDQSAIDALQTQLSTGRRITKASQDPAAAIRGLAAQRQLEYKSQVDVNLKNADSILSVTESTLSQAQAILNKIRGIAVQAAGTTYSEDERRSFVTEIQTATQRLADLGNTKFRDQFLFSGSDVLNSPFSFAKGTIRFSGNAEELQTISDFGATVAANVTANDAFGVTSTKVVGTVDLNPSVSADTPLALLNQGEGIRLGAISLSSGVDSVEIDLGNSYNLSDVIGAIESHQVGSRNLTATLTANGLSIDYADGLGGILRVGDVGSGTAASDLGIHNLDTPALSPVVGSDLDPVLTNTTRISQLLGGAGLGAGSTFQLQQGDETHTISTNNLDTVEDLINAIYRTGARVEASIDASGRFLAIQSTESGSTLSIGENGGTLASALGIRTMDLNTSVDQLNFGQGIYTSDLGDDLILTRTDGSELAVDLTGVQNVEDVLLRINNHANNFTPALRIEASLSTTGNGIVLTAPTGAQEIAVKNAGGSQAAWGLGLVSTDQTETVGATVGASSVIGGADVSGVEVEGIFTSLIRMQQAIENDRPEEMVRLTSALDADIQRLALARGFTGTRQQAIENTLDLSADQQVRLKEVESDELDADLAEVISDLAGRQAALQASLQLMGQTTRQSLFDYL